MHLHEYQTKLILERSGIHVPGGIMVQSPGSARKAVEDLGGTAWMVKAQIHAGGRGKAGGIRFAQSPAEAEYHARSLIGTELITTQTGQKGMPVRKIYIEKAVTVRKEFYLAIVMDRSVEAPVIAASVDGGSDIESIAEKSAGKILREIIDPLNGLQDGQVQKIASHLSSDQQQQRQIMNLTRALYKIFSDKDATLIEINPLALTGEGNLVALDAKMSVDDNALFRQNEIALMQDPEEGDPLEAEAALSGLSYIRLDGNVGCIVNGAGLAMATMDIIKYYGGEPANFLDVGGRATSDTIARGLSLIGQNRNVRSIFVNIIGGIVRCDRIAEGIIAWRRKTEGALPLVVRLAGTNAEEAVRILSESRLEKIIVADDFSDGTQKAVKAAGI